MYRPTTRELEPRGPAGFTLVELMLVLSLVVVLAALAAPSLSGTLARVRLEAAAEAVRTAWADARLEAMRTGQPVVFQCRLGTGEYTLSKLTDATAALAGATDTADQEQLANDEHEDLGAITFTQLSVGDPLDPLLDPSVAACVVFRPDGAADDAWAIVEAANGQRRQITLRGLTGAARIEEVAVSEGT
ncbi:hypothetical protein Pla108_27270 [Botrimarina colliarenosi]|uniref:General secretion pathway protein H n=1 Tax=Botrimarina colliarenosi TaxID=2528001 RepID=A0A5C6AC09_9BACT|nr:GspH/FimT family pseudopilin [Botrimarina colliarenosi]TWT96950.1 hypothetical protein Pla108_27270 [Botrimarina colliarenosi]